MKTKLTLLLIFSSFIAFSQNPIADFQVNIDYKCGYATTEFINNSINADTFLWDKNGNGYYIETFEPKGSNIGINKKWIVTLIAKQNGLNDTISKEVEVFNTNIKFEKTIADTNMYSPLSVDFINTSEIREGDTVTYNWDFGDGINSSQINPVHIYELPNTYYLTLTGKKADGCELSFSDYVIVKDTAQKGEFEFIISNCLSESETPPCGYDKNYKLINDSLFIYGFYSGNCGTHKTATIRYSGDTVKIKTWEVGPETTCSCGYCFEIIIPDITQDSVIVVFNGTTLLPTLTNISEQSIDNSILKIFPNPVNDNLTLFIKGIETRNCEYKILDTEGRILQNGIISNESQIGLKNIDSGVYIICISNKIENIEYVTKFIKK